MILLIFIKIKNNKRYFKSFFGYIGSITKRIRTTHSITIFRIFRSNNFPNTSCIKFNLSIITIFNNLKFFKTININRITKTIPLSIINRVNLISYKKIIPTFISTTGYISIITNCWSKSYRSNRKFFIRKISIITNTVIIFISEINSSKRNFFLITIILGYSNYKTTFNIISKCTFNFTIMISKIMVCITISNNHRTSFIISKYMSFSSIISSDSYDNKFSITRYNTYNLITIGKMRT